MSSKSTKQFSILALVSGVAVAVLTIFYIGLQRDPKEMVSPLLGKEALAFDVQALQWAEAKGLGGERIRWEDIKGRRVILNFWASWCHSCRTEGKDLNAYWLANKDQNLLVLGIAVQDNENDAKDFASRFGKGYVLGLDDSSNTAIDYGVTGVPETFWINEEGKIVHKETGPVDLAILEARSKEFFQ